MPLTYTDSGNIQNVADAEAVNATVANRPHNKLKTRTDEVATFVDELEALDYLDRGLSVYSTQPVYWGGTIADSGNGKLQIGREAAGEIRFVSHGEDNGDATFVVPYNNLASFFGSTTIAADEVLYFEGPSADLDGRTYSTGTFPYTVPSSKIFTAGSCPKWGIPIGRVRGTEFICAFTGVVLSKGEESFFNPMAVGASGSPVHGVNYLIEGGDFACSISASNIRVTVGNKIVITLLGVTAANNEIAASTVIDIPVDSVAYVDLNTAVSATALSVTVVGTSSYVAANNRVPLFWRPTTATETLTTEYWLHILGPNDVIRAASVNYYQYTIGGNGTILKLGGPTIGASQPTYIEAEVSNVSNGTYIQTNSNELHLKNTATATELEIDYTTNATHVTLSTTNNRLYLTGPTCEMEFNVSSTECVLDTLANSWQIRCQSGSNESLTVVNDGGGTMDLLLDGKYQYTTPETHDVWCSALAWRGDTSLIANIDYATGEIRLDQTVSTSNVLAMDLTPYLIDGGEITQVELVYEDATYASGVFTMGVDLRTADATVGTVASAIGGADILDISSFGVGTGDRTHTVGSLSVTVDKSSNNYFLYLLAGLGTDSSHTINVFNVKITQTTSELTRGG